MKKILFVDACIRGSESRTKKISENLIGQLTSKDNYELETIDLGKEQVLPLDLDTLNRRTQFIENNNFSDEIFDYAKQFASADLIVIGAPYWDLSFPAVLKNYFEMTSVCGIAFCYGSDGAPKGLCKAQKLYYVTTAGGYIGNYNFGYDYVTGLSMLYGIEAVELIKAEGLDIEGVDSDEMIKNALGRVKNIHN